MIAGCPNVLQRESPGAEPFIGVRVGRACDALGSDPRIDLLGEGFVLDETARFAGVILHPLLLPRRLDAAVVHPEEKTPRPLQPNST